MPESELPHDPSAEHTSSNAEFYAGLEGAQAGPAKPEPSIWSREGSQSPEAQAQRERELYGDAPEMPAPSEPQKPFDARLPRRTIVEGAQEPLAGRKSALATASIEAAPQIQPVAQAEQAAPTSPELTTAPGAQAESGTEGEAKSGITFREGQQVAVRRSSGETDYDWAVVGTLDNGKIRVVGPAEGGSQAPYKDVAPEALAAVQPRFESGQAVRYELDGAPSLIHWRVAKQNELNGKVTLTSVDSDPRVPGATRLVIVDAAGLTEMQAEA